MSDDRPRQAAATDDTEYSLSIEDAAAMYDRAGLPRTIRTIQRYCAKGHLDSHRIETPYGEKFLITPASVLKHIAYIEEVRPVAAGRDKPRLVATGNSKEKLAPEEQRQPPTGRDEPRPVAANDEMMSHYVAHLEGENGYLREQNKVKDEQIGALLERDAETNFLIRGLQGMLTPLLARPADGAADDRPYPHIPAEEVPREPYRAN